MASGIRVPFLSDTADFIRGVRSMGDTLTDSLDRAFRDVADDADRAGDDIEDAFKDAGRAAERALDDMADDARTSSRRTGDAFDDIGGEAQDVAKQVATSFDGSMESVADGARDLSAEVGSMFGPIGTAVGGALAVGIGIFTERWRESKEEIAEGASTLFDELIESAGHVSEAFKNAQYKEFIDENLELVETVQTLAGSEGLALLREAVGGNAEAAAELTDLIYGNSEAFQFYASDVTDASGLTQGLTREAQDVVDALRDEESSIGEATRAMDLYTEALDRNTEAKGRNRKAKPGTGTTSGGPQP